MNAPTLKSESAGLVPLADIPNVAWMKLTDAANNVHDPLRIVTIANVDPCGRPDARLMIIRGVDRAAGRIWLHTDRRARKVSQLHRDPHVCMVAYDSGDRIMLRLTGKATLHTRDKIADDHWQQMMVSMRHAFGLPDSPTQALPKADPRLAHLWQHQRTLEIAHDRAHFAVIQIAVDTLEWLQTCGLQQRHAVLHAADNWALKAPEPTCEQEETRAQ